MNISNLSFFSGKQSKKKKRINLPLITISILLVIICIGYEEVNQFTSSKQKNNQSSAVFESLHPKPSEILVTISEGS